MRSTFVETANVTRFQRALGQVERRGAAEACLMVVDGPPGLGKTTVMRHWAAQTGSVYLRAKKEWTPCWFMRELIGEMGATAPHAFERQFRMALEMLADRQADASITGRTFGIVIDEADHVARQARIMETVRDISDTLELPIILVGMGRVRDALVRYPQVASRIGQYVRFEPSDRRDVHRLLDGLCEIPVADDLAGYVARVTRGYTREIKEAIAHIERFGHRNPPADPKVGLTLADMAGQVIVNDRKTGQPIRIPAAAAAAAAKGRAAA